LNLEGDLTVAAQRKSAQQLAAREKARAKARELTERHEKLIELAAEFFEQQAQAEAILEEAKQRAAELLAKADAEAQDAVRSASDTVQAMLESGESRSAVAARLGVSVAELKRLTSQAKTVDKSAGNQLPDAIGDESDLAPEDVQVPAA
jgi:vacuolar-type H+-ATPase subunit H